jgi:putative tryptophan/tyrosine transport system substrate-binding protein
VHVFGAEIIPKRLELLREVLPQPGLIAFLVGPQTQATPEQLRQVEAAAQAVGQPILVLHGRNDDEIEKAFATMAERQVRGLLYGGSEYFQVIADRLIALAARYRIPASYQWREFVAAGGLMSYSPSRRESARLTGDYAGRILPRRFAGHPINALRAGHQPGDRKGARPDDPAHGVATRRRGHRVRQA